MHMHIKRWVTGLAVLAIAFVWAPSLQANTQHFTLDNFEADYYISRDEGNVAIMRVRETITAQFPQSDQNHGILRAMPQTYRGHSLELSVEDVSDGQQDLPYTSYTENDHTVLRIGDADRFVHGTQKYVVDYTMRGVDSFTYGAQQFYWNINGTQWQQPIKSVTARVHLMGDLAEAAHIDQALCYTGADGSTDSDCKISTQKQQNETVVTFTTSRGLNAAETLSVVLPFPLETFAPYTPSAGLIMRWVGLGLAIIVPPLLALWYMVHRWRRFGRDPKGRGVIVPQYLPPKEVGVLGANGVMAEGFEAKAVSATIIDLAVRHYIKVYEQKIKQFMHTKTNYELELVKTPHDLRPEEKQIVTMLFGESAQPGAKISMESLAKTGTFHAKAQAVGEQVTEQLTQDDYFAAHPGKAKLPYLLFGVALMVAGFFFLPWTAGVMAGGLILLIGSQAMPARTIKGVLLREYMLGLRSYMELAEAERLRVLQSPHGELTQKIDVHDSAQLVKLYEKLLPYAMLFGIEQEWAKQFAHLYQKPPDWYSGSGTFNAVYFAGSLHGFATAANTSFSPPSSSGSGAGGGGGGGGGGGW